VRGPSYNIVQSKARNTTRAYEHPRDPEYLAAYDRLCSIEKAAKACGVTKATIEAARKRRRDRLAQTPRKGVW